MLATRQSDNEPMLLCMPGTHSKWLLVDRAGRISWFSTFMTGEPYRLPCCILPVAVCQRIITHGPTARGVICALFGTFFHRPATDGFEATAVEITCARRLGRCFYCAVNISAKPIDRMAACLILITFVPGRATRGKKFTRNISTSAVILRSNRSIAWQHSPSEFGCISIW